MTCTVEGCVRPIRARGMCPSHLNKFHRYGDPLGGDRHARDSDPFDRIAERVRIVRGPLPTPCFLWTGKQNSHGYGRLSINGREVLVHRWIYLRWFGPVPDGLELDHLCSTPSCVNAGHLEPVTHQENMVRAFERRRVRQALAAM